MEYRWTEECLSKLSKYLVKFSFYIEIILLTIAFVVGLWFRPVAVFWNWLEKKEWYLLFEGLKHVKLAIPEFESPSFKQVDDFVNVVEAAKENKEVK